MGRNLGNSTLRRRARRGDPMRDFDGLPAELQAWIASAALPWCPKSVHRAYRRTLARTSDRTRAIMRLGEIEKRLLARDGRRVWGADHPDLLRVE